MPDPFTSLNVFGVPAIAFTDDELKDRIVAASLAFADTCQVYGDDGQFQVHTHMATEEARTLWNLLDIWKLIHPSGGGA